MKAFGLMYIEAFKLAFRLSVTFFWLALLLPEMLIMILRSVLKIMMSKLTVMMMKLDVFNLAGPCC